MLTPRSGLGAREAPPLIRRTKLFPGNDGFRIPDEDAAEIATLKDAVNYLKGHGVEDG